MIFPRYHQLDAPRKLVADVREKGPRQRHLVQHSAGSGKPAPSREGLKDILLGPAQLYEALRARSGEMRP